MKTLAEARDWVRGNLREVAETFAAEGLPRPALDGKLLRPLSAYLLVPEDYRGQLDRRFWSGALAVEMVHEASLLHDDILDDAPERRGKPTMAASAGVGPALVMGDHLLTAAYRAAAATESPEFLHVFIRSVERTVAGEIAQEKSQGRILEDWEYTRAIMGKSGELFRIAFSLSPTLLGIGSVDRTGDLGARFGRLYQMVDDFLDYCPGADRGKPPLQDFRQQKWTWPLGLIEAEGFDAPEDEILDQLFSRTRSYDPSHMESGATEMAASFQSLLEDLREEGLETREVRELLEGWSRLLETATRSEAEARNRTRAQPRASERAGQAAASQRREPSPALQWDLRAAAEGLETPEGRLAYFGRHATSFRFASRLFPREALGKVAGVYAFCRFTDDLVDEVDDEDRALAGARLNTWLGLARKAYEGHQTGIVLLDDVMTEMRAASVPFHYAEALGEGMRMDLEISRYATLEELRVYSYRVASVVGGWLTELFGIHDPWVLDRAFALGHAMQLTNILRDVGEDLRLGRLYLPEDLMRRHGVDRELLDAKARNGSLAFPGYRRLMEELMDEADADYEKAFEAIPALPRFFRGPVAVAAKVYQGIHEEIRQNEYDNLGRRARTSLLRKVGLATEGLLALRRATRKASRNHEKLGLLPRFGGEEEQEAVS
jgi:phytoene synthase